MNKWFPPYRICVVNTDTTLLKSTLLATEGDTHWQVHTADSLWEAALLAINAGIHVVIVSENLEKEDINLNIFDELRFFACRKMPIPFLFVKVNQEEKHLPFPFSKKLTSTGSINQIKTNLNLAATDMLGKGNTWSRYSEYQFISFIKGKHESPGGILTNHIPEHYLVYASVWGYLSERRITEAFDQVECAVKKIVSNLFLNTTLSLLYYQQKKILQARESLNTILNENNENPLMLYVVFIFIELFHDSESQFIILEFLNRKFPKSYPTLLANGIWNSHKSHIELGINQLLGCLEKQPNDIFAGSTLAKLLRGKGYPAMSSGVQNHVCSVLPKTDIYQHMFADLLGVR